MQTSTYCILVIAAFFALLFHAIHAEEKRCSERRKEDLPHPAERRRQDRRREQTRTARAFWALRARWQSLTGRQGQ